LHRDGRARLRQSAVLIHCDELDQVLAGRQAFRV
jgi:hypothetical protein